MVKWTARLDATLQNLGVSSYLRAERYLQIMQKQLQKNKPTVRRFHFSAQLCTSDGYSGPKQAAKPLLQGCPWWVWIIRGCQKQKISLLWLGGWVEKVSKAYNLLYLLERSLFSSSSTSCVAGNEAESADRLTQPLPRWCLLRNPPWSVPRLQEPACCAIPVAFCLAVKGAFPVCQCFVPALRGQQVPGSSYPQRCLPTAPHIQDRAPCVTHKAGQGEAIICLCGKSPWSPNATAWMLMPMQAGCFKKTGALHLLSSIPFLSPAGFHSHRNARAPFTCSVCNPSFWLLIKTVPTLLPLLQFY